MPLATSGPWARALRGVTALLRRLTGRHHPRTTDVPATPAVPDESRCRACRWELGEAGWTSDGPTYVVCDCCGAETGVDDVTPDEALTYRREWIAQGALWFDPERRPAQWDLYRQLWEGTEGSRASAER